MDLAPFVGIPYSGNKFCRTFAAQVLAANGIPMPEVDVTADAPEWMRVERPQPLDVVVFNLAGKPAHVGVCIGRGRFLHVEEGERSRIEHLSSSLWCSRIEGFYRYQGAA